MTPLTALLQRRKSSGKKSLGVFLTAGYPSTDHDLQLLRQIADAGADFIEIGMPFSDPLAEGPTIQYSSQVALDNGVDMAYVLRLAQRFTRDNETPLVLMGYVNPIIAYGVGNFCRDAQSVGVSGIIVPDVPYGERPLLNTHAEEHGLDFIQLVAPTSSDERIEEAATTTRGFLYAVALVGLTGGETTSPNYISAYLEKAMSHSVSPVLAGFGVKTADDAFNLGKLCDGCIVGSAVIELIRKTWIDESVPIDQKIEMVGGFVRQLSAGVARGSKSP